jgi:hypothetical protein
MADAEAAANREERAEKLDAAAEEPRPMTPGEPAAEPAAADEPAAEQAAEPAAAAVGPQGSIGIELGTDKCVVAASSVRRAATAVLVRNDVSNEAT